ncbi:MAG TPA: cyclic nucleotide-binding domain-containing protein [Gaiellaceae bacterium]|jgi:voltage-gated potassium channel
MDVTAAELAAVPLFASLDEAELQEVAGWFDVRAVGEGMRIAGEGASGYFFFVLAEGTAAVTLDGEEIATLGPGDFFGEMALLGDGRRTATVTTTSATRLLVLFGTDFRKLEQQLPDAAVRIESAMRDRAARAAG